jgi:hypothetical protein
MILRANSITGATRLSRLFVREFGNSRTTKRLYGVEPAIRLIMLSACAWSNHQGE